MGRNPFAEDTTVKRHAEMRIRVVAIEDRTVTLAQEFIDDQGHSVTLKCDFGMKAGDTMVLAGLKVTMSIEQE